ncbi:hypothetical protein TNCV_3416911 [Trichonephila clavipes]|nr:hypothetical protein TNCV_3416911 [Trichonephila clavipes]
MCGKRVWSVRKTTRRGSWKHLWITVTRSTIRADVGVAIVPQTISRHLVEANLKSSLTFPCTPFNTGTSATASTVVPSQINVWNVTDWQKGCD